MIIISSVEPKQLDAAMHKAKDEPCLVCGEQASSVNVWQPNKDGIYKKDTIFFFCLCDRHDKDQETENIANICEKSYFSLLTALTINPSKSTHFN